MNITVRKHLLSIKPYVPGKPIEEVKRELELKRVIKLASNENAFGASPKVREAVREALQNIHRYPDGSCYYLRQELASRLKVDHDQLIFGNGSDELIVLSIRALVNPGDEVIIARPSFLVYAIASQIARARIKSIPLVHYRYDLEGMRKAVTPKTRIIFIGNPDNPSGSYLSQNEVVRFLKAVPEDVLVFMDEAYYEYVDAPDYVDSLGLLNRYPNLFVSRTFSKMYALAGLRIGYGIAAVGFIDILNRLREPFNVNALAQVAALAALKDRRYYKEVAAKINTQRQFLYAGLKNLRLKFIETATNFILIEMRATSVDVAKRLLKKGIIVRDMSGWGMDHFMRVTIGTPSENKFFLNALEEMV